MKKYVVLFALALVCVACGNHKGKSEEPKKPVMEIVNGEYSVYGVLDSVIYLPVLDSTQFEVKVYQGQEALMLESPNILIGNLFGLQSTTGALHNLKYSFSFIGKKDDMYIYAIPYCEMDDYFGSYYLANLEHCWIYFRFDNEETNIIHFSKAEFEQLFDIVKAHIVN